VTCGDQKPSTNQLTLIPDDTITFIVKLTFAFVLGFFYFDKDKASHINSNVMYISIYV